MACRNCPKRGNPSGAAGRRLAARSPGETVKLKYLGESPELVTFEGAATRTEYVVGGRINLVDAYGSDIATGISWAPGLLELTGEGGRKLFKIHVPLTEEIEAEAKAEALKRQAWEAAEALALPPEEPEAEPKPKSDEADDGQDSISTD